MPHRLVPVSGGTYMAVIAVEPQWCASSQLAVALFFTGAALDWKEYENRDYSFTIHFPSTQRSKQRPIKPPMAGRFRRTVFSAKQGTGTFKVTVVEMPGEETGPDAAVTKEATKAVAGGGTVKFDIPHRVRAVWPATGHRRSERWLFLRRAVLPDITASIRSRATRSSPGQAEVDAMRFQQSLDLT
jgi:hypothetical protein